MYKGVNYRQHNLKQRQMCMQFLQSKNLLANATARINNISITEQEQSDTDDVLWAQLQKINMNANRDKRNESISNSRQPNNTNYGQNTTINYPIVNNSNIHINQQFQESNSNQSGRRNIQQTHHSFNQSLNNYMRKSFKRSSFEEPAEEEQTNQFPTESNYGSKISNKEPKKKKQKKKAKNKQEDNYPIENIITEKSDNLFTVDKLKIQQPLTKNYRVADKNEWENNRKIEDYKLKYVLRHFPKIKDYRNNQKAIIKCSLLGNDVFVCMPTGGGKSLTFQAMTFIEKGVYLCILPLVSLIIDQQQQAKGVGIKAFSLTGSKEIQDNKQIYQQLLRYEPGSDSLVVFCTPEKVNKSPQFFNVLQQVYQNKALVKIVIDEVHCVSTWGKQFRQDYQNLSSLRQNFPTTPILGLTATVTQVIKQDIIKRLGIKNCFYFQSSFNRPNLYYEVKQKNKDVLNNIIKIITQYQNQSGIIYCVSRKDCEQMCQQLRSKRFKVAFYHANISQNQKRQIQSKWMRNQIQIIIATIAFGMGINKPDVRFVIHHSLSKSLQNYYQQSGRAGRDGEEAKCILFYRKGDKVSLQCLIMKNQISKDDNKNFCMKQLSNMIKYCQDRYMCRRKFQLQYLGEKDFNPDECNKTCDNCKRGLKYIEVQCIKQAKFLIQFVIAAEKIKQNISQNQIIMLCKGVGDKKFKYKVEQIQRSIDLSQLKQIFKKWSKLHIDQLITELLSCEVFYEKIVTTNTYKNNVVSNFYIKVNFGLANKFLQKVETLPMKKNFFNNFEKKGKQMGSFEISDAQFDFPEEQLINEDILNGDFDSDQFEQGRYSFEGSKKQIQQP